MKKIQPKTVQRVFCPRCRELMVKFYPWSGIMLKPDLVIPECGECFNKLAAKNETLAIKKIVR